MADYTDIDKLRELAEAATPLSGFPGYAISQDGTVWSVGSNWRGYGARPLRAVPNADGYLKVRLVVNGRRVNRTVHGLVATTFHGRKPSERSQVRHLNGDCLDNRAANLRWGTALENADDRNEHGTTARGARSGTSKLSERDVREIRGHLAAGGSQRVIAARYDVSQTTISKIKLGKWWRHVI